MAKKTSVIVLAIVAVLVVAIGVFACLPIFNVGEHDVYISPLTRLQGSNTLSDKVVASYSVDAENDSDWDNISSIIRTRMAEVYGFYGCSVSCDKTAKLVSVTAPEISTVVTNDNGVKINVDKDNSATVQSYIANAVVGGKVEISKTTYSSSSSNYTASDIQLKPEHFEKNASISRYVNGNNVFHIVEVKLNKDGQEAAKTLTSSTSSSYPVYIDESLAAYCFKASSSVVQIYTGSDTAAKMVKSYINHGVIDATLTLDTVEPVQNAGGIIFAVAFALMMIASWVLFLVRFKALGVAGIYSSLIAVILFVIAMGLFGVEIFNIASAIGAVLVYASMTFVTYKTFASINAFAQSKTFAASCYKGFAANNKLNLILHGAMLVLGAILWLIPTLVTAPLGNVLVYATVLSFAATMGLNRLFAALVASIAEGAQKASK